MKTLVLDSWYDSWTKTKIPGGAEKVGLEISKILNADFYTSVSDGSKEIEGVNIIQSEVPVKSTWNEETNSRKMQKNRDQEIKSIANQYDLIINNSSSASHVNALAKLVRTKRIPAINYSHSSFAIYSFPRFGMISAMQNLKNAGGINITTCQSVIDQAKTMIEKKRQYVGENVDENKLFAGWIFPTIVDYVPVPNQWNRNPYDICTMTRYAEDKNVEELSDFLISWRKKYSYEKSKIAAHFIVAANKLEEFEKYSANLQSHGIEIRYNLSQKESFDRFSTFGTFLMASHTECFPLTPIECGALGLSCLYIEKGMPHAVRSSLPKYSKSMVKNKRGSWSHAENISMLEPINIKPENISDFVRSTYSKERFEKDLYRYIDIATSKQMSNYLDDFQ